jgi:hypothetical protein
MQNRELPVILKWKWKSWPWAKEVISRSEQILFSQAASVSAPGIFAAPDREQSSERESSAGVIHPRASEGFFAQNESGVVTKINWTLGDSARVVNWTHQRRVCAIHFVKLSLGAETDWAIKVCAERNSAPKAPLHSASWIYLSRSANR